jgi:hypothetical protein
MFRCMLERFYLYCVRINAFPTLRLFYICHVRSVMFGMLFDFYSTLLCVICCFALLQLW